MKGRSPRLAAFSIVELLVATAVLFIVMVVLLQLTGGVGQIWKSSSGKISSFQNARSAFAVINRTLARATLNTYNDYVDAAGSYRSDANSANFSPAQFMRASELQFLAGPSDQIVPGGDAAKNPGDAIFFQAPLGDSDEASLAGLNRSLNSTGFYIQYGTPDDALLPGWLKPLFGGARRFRLVQMVEPAEKLKVYASTAAAGYDLDWLKSFKTPADTTQPRPRVLAEDIALLVFRPRLSPKDEETAAVQLGTTMNDAARGSILAPNYHYDSRAWESGYPPGQRVKAALSPAVRADITRNQVPPIVDVAMVSLDRQSLARLDQSGDVPPSVLRVPAGLFTDSSKLDADLAAYGQQLSQAGIRYRVFRTSVEIQGAKWSNN